MTRKFMVATGSCVQEINMDWPDGGLDRLRDLQRNGSHEWEDLVSTQQKL